MRKNSSIANGVQIRKSCFNVAYENNKFYINSLKMQHRAFAKFLHKRMPLYKGCDMDPGPLIIIHHQQCSPSGSLNFKFSPWASTSCCKKRCQSKQTVLSFYPHIKIFTDFTSNQMFNIPCM